MSGVAPAKGAPTESSKPRSAFAMLAAESDEEDDGAVFGELKARKATTTAKPAAKPKGPVFKFEDEPAPKAAAPKPAIAPALPIDDEPAFEIEDDLEEADFDDDEVDAW